MTTIFAAGLFDNPWVVVVILVGGALINWLSQRRQAKQQGEEPRPEGDAAPSANKPSGEFNMEETLRRLLGEQLPPPASAPPPIPTTPTAPKVAPRRTSWVGSTAAARRPPPGLMPPPLEVAPAAANYEGGQTREQAALRFEQLNEQGQHPAKALDLRRHRSQTGASDALWHDRKSVRRAFVASLVFGPPKGLES